VVGAIDEGSPLRRAGRGSDRVVGTLVHRLLQRLGVGAASSPGVVRDAASRLVRPDEVDESGDLDALLDAAAAAYAAMCAHEDVRAIYLPGQTPRPTLHEVPFTMAIDGVILRGTVDCLVQTAPGRFTVLEFKTGRERPEHHAQVELYRRAMQQVFPGCVVEARLVYAGPGAV
jgi:ATP-dependent exoDNAse (exonuclease V) beta subunit